MQYNSCTDVCQTIINSFWVKGAVISVLPHCQIVWRDEQALLMTPRHSGLKNPTWMAKNCSLFDFPAAPITGRNWCWLSQVPGNVIMPRFGSRHWENSNYWITGSSRTSLCINDHCLNICSTCRVITAQGRSCWQQAKAVFGSAPRLEFISHQRWQYGCGA